MDNKQLIGFRINFLFSTFFMILPKIAFLGIVFKSITVSSCKIGWFQLTWYFILSRRLKMLELMLNCILLLTSFNVLWKGIKIIQQFVEYKTKKVVSNMLTHLMSDVYRSELVKFMLNVRSFSTFIFKVF